MQLERHEHSRPAAMLVRSTYSHHNLYENQYGMDSPLFCCKTRQGVRQL